MKSATISIISIWMVAASTKALATIPTLYCQIAQLKGVPPVILYAIALTESGYQFPLSATDKTDYHPWPWSLNIDGKPLRFKNRQTVLRQLKAAIDKGQSVDGGLMQINWYWHKQRFTQLDQIIEPYHNLAVGADILAEQFQRTRNWWQAIGAYYAPGKDKASLQRANAYRQRVRLRLKALDFTDLRGQ